jgi:hypothetical protein
VELAERLPKNGRRLEFTFWSLAATHRLLKCLGDSGKGLSEYSCNAHSRYKRVGYQWEWIWRAARL